MQGLTFSALVLYARAIVIVDELEPTVLVLRHELERSFVIELTKQTKTMTVSISGGNVCAGRSFHEP